MGNGSSKLDMTHSLTANVLLSNLNAALFAHLVLMTDTLIFTAKALPVLGRSKDTLAEQTVTLSLERAVVDGLGLLDLAVGP